MALTEFQIKIYRQVPILLVRSISLNLFGDALTYDDYVPLVHKEQTKR